MQLYWKGTVWDRWHRFFTCRIPASPSCYPVHSVRALKDTHPCLSTTGLLQGWDVASFMLAACNSLSNKLSPLRRHSVGKQSSRAFCWTDSVFAITFVHQTYVRSQPRTRCCPEETFILQFVLMFSTTASVPFFQAGVQPTLDPIR